MYAILRNLFKQFCVFVATFMCLFPERFVTFSVVVDATYFT